MLDAIFLLLGILLLLNFIKTLVKSRSPLKNAVISMLAGVGSLAAASLIATLFDIRIAVNIFTVFIALVLGVPGVVLIVLKMFFI